MGVVSLSELVSRGATLEDLLNFQALELIEPAADTQLVRFVTRLALLLEEVKLRLSYMLDPKTKHRIKWATQRDLFPSELDVIEGEDPAKEQEALRRRRASVLEQLASFFKYEKVVKK